MKDAKRVFLLGAGFSVPAGLPVNLKLLDQLISKSAEKVKRYGYGNLDELGGIEDVLKSQHSTQLLPPLLLRFLRSKYPDLRNFERFMEIAELFAGGHVRLKDATSEEDRLWSLARSEPHYLCASTLNNCVHAAVRDVFEDATIRDTKYIDALVRYAHATGSPIYTTNFDTLIEKSCQNCGLWPDVPGTHSEIPVDLVPAGFKLFKMHGSIDWDPCPVINHDMVGDYIVSYRRGIDSLGYQNIALDVRDKLGRMALMLPHINSLAREWVRGTELVVIGNDLNDNHLAALVIGRLHVPGFRLTLVNNSNELPQRLYFSNEQIMRATNGASKIEVLNLSSDAYCCSLRF